MQWSTNLKICIYLCTKPKYEDRSFSGFIRSHHAWSRVDIKVSVESYFGLTVDFCTKMNASYILRGLRTSADFEFERSVAQVNLKLVPEIETVFMLALPEYVMVTSSIVREVHKHGGNIEQFIPEVISI